MSEEISLQFLSQFISSFDGTGNLSAFIRNCDHAMNLANPTQKPIIFAFIQSKISGKADLVMSTRDLPDWPSYRSFLSENFLPRKKFSQLLIELQSSKQISSETVTEFTQRFENCISRLLQSVKNETSNLNDLKGKYDMIKEVALQTFLIGILPQYHLILRARNPKTFEEASEYAIEEERVTKFIRTNGINNSKIICNNCKKSGHTSTNCYKNRSVYPPTHKFQHINHPNTKSEPVFHSNTITFCNYCKNQGHLIRECRKREALHGKFKQLESNHSKYNNSRRHSNNSHHLNSKISANPADSRKVNTLEAESLF